MTTEEINILNKHYEENYKRAHDELEEIYSDGELLRMANAASIIDYLRSNDLMEIKWNQHRIIDKLLTINANIETLLRRQQ